MRSHAGVASKMFGILAEESINIQMISTSEIKISVVIDEKYLELAVRALHAGFQLDQQLNDPINRPEKILLLSHCQNENAGQYFISSPGQ